MTSPSAGARRLYRPRSGPRSRGQSCGIEKEPSRPARACASAVPTKAWVTTANYLKEAEETFARAGGGVARRSSTWSSRTSGRGRRQADDRRRRDLFKANGVEWVQGTGRFEDANTIAVEGGEDVTSRARSSPQGRFPIRPPIEGSTRRSASDSTGLFAQDKVPARLVVLGGGIIGCEFADLSALRLRGDDRDAAASDPGGGRGCSEGAAQQFGKRGIASTFEQQCTKVEDKGGSLTGALR